MTASTALTTTRPADSTDRTATLPAPRPGSTGPRPAGRLSGFARRFVSALMRSLAAPHI